MENESSKPAPVHLTAKEIEIDAKKRLSIIDKEFKEGFSFIRKYPKSVTFFGSAVLKEGNPHYEQARRLASRLAKLGYAIVTGGGGGIMEAANRGAYEAKGKSVGLNIALPHEQRANNYLTDGYQFYYFFSRKVALSFAAEAYLVFPGGYGTLNEFFELVTLVQTNRIRPVLIIAVGADFWKPLETFMRDILLTREGVLDEPSTKLYKISDDEDEIVKAILKEPVIDSVSFENDVKQVGGLPNKE